MPESGPWPAATGHRARPPPPGPSGGSRRAGRCCSWPYGGLDHGRAAGAGAGGVRGTGTRQTAAAVDRGRSASAALPGAPGQAPARPPALLATAQVLTGTAPSAVPTALVQRCRIAVATGEDAARAGGASYRDWARHVQAQLDLDTGRTTWLGAVELWNATRSAGGGDARAFEPRRTATRRHRRRLRHPRGANRRAGARGGDGLPAPRRCAGRARDGGHPGDRRLGAAPGHASGSRPTTPPVARRPCRGCASPGRRCPRWAGSARPGPRCWKRPPAASPDPRSALAPRRAAAGRPDGRRAGADRPVGSRRCRRRRAGGRLGGVTAGVPAAHAGGGRDNRGGQP